MATESSGDVDPNNHRWWKGSLPSWMGVALITVTMFAGKRLLEEHDRLITQVNILGNRVVALEAEVKAMQVAVHGVGGKRSPL